MNKKRMLVLKNDPNLLKILKENQPVILLMENSQRNIKRVIILIHDVIIMFIQIL